MECGSKKNTKLYIVVQIRLDTYLKIVLLLGKRNNAVEKINGIVCVCSSSFNTGNF